MQLKIQQQKRNACAKLQKAVEWNFSNLEISIFFSFKQIYPTEFFLILNVNWKDFYKKYGVTRLGFKIDAIDFFRLIDHVMVLLSTLALKLSNSRLLLGMNNF